MITVFNRSCCFTGVDLAQFSEARGVLDENKIPYKCKTVSYTHLYIEDAKCTAAKENLPAEFICADIREVTFENEFDVVLNLADGAIGYLESEEENLKIFDVISRALKRGGKHFMDVCSAAHAEKYYTKTNWEIGEKALALAQFDWDAASRRMLYGGADIPYLSLIHI